LLAPDPRPLPSDIVSQCGALAVRGEAYQADSLKVHSSGKIGFCVNRIDFGRRWKSGQSKNVTLNFSMFDALNFCILTWKIGN
jgi:hypothetical protein